MKSRAHEDTSYFDDERVWYAKELHRRIFYNFCRLKQDLLVEVALWWSNLIYYYKNIIESLSPNV